MSQIDYHKGMASNEFVATSVAYIATSVEYSDCKRVEESMNGWVYPGMTYPWCGFLSKFSTMLFYGLESPGEFIAWGTHAPYTGTNSYAI